ncbi:hypothetical protein GCM10007052_29080 [Halioglobus japonicus]|uniref:hypothetical protein n=1 Tax=Halioglobus japonicus TaxID=930805 RepID=UPI0012F4838D|nr:hypothetical protein [Halioglobus japonicus]GHD20110.1 hypothetical protein GCM10007052_29080 [Halioglobus japonicus]
MNKWGERFVIYTALAVLCGMTAAFAGTAAALWSFLQVLAVIELIYWIAQPATKSQAKG